MTRIYIAGPMSGIEDFNRPAFNDVAGVLRMAEGVEVVNPAERDLGPGAGWGDYMRLALADMLTCDLVVMIEGWQESRGALLEANVAQRVGIRVVTLDDFAVTLRQSVFA